MADSQNLAAATPPPNAEVSNHAPLVREADLAALEPHPRDLKRAYDELRVQYQRCATALATAAHDLRTPLAVIAGYVELLVNQKLGPLTEKQLHVLEDMQVSSIRLQRLVTDFLTFASLQTDVIPIRAEDPQDMNACLQELSGFWLPRFQNKGVAFYYLENANLEPFAFDYDKIQRVVSNLLENALKFTPSAGTVWLHAEPQLWERRSSHKPHSSSERRKANLLVPNAVRVTVADTGPGIAPEYHQEIFGDFFQVPDSGVEDDSGMGLGLAITRRLVQAHGGKVWVESEPNCGCKFSFLLPLKRNANKDQ
ncbi:MAG TPA: HAMP domain-containing sensor histidine kinase [Terriglobales bacterium]|nr:HAMP domain-containing sensor histidine kinase [Terriglobales bacterium]